MESLELGAIDFIPKPYPVPGVIKARMRRIIELTEDRDIIESTERDSLTGLYNKEYFYSYAAQLDQYNESSEMDAVLVDINHFHLVNERYGKAYGDLVLTRLSDILKEIVAEAGGIACRQGADTFLHYVPHREDHEALAERVAASLMDEGSEENRVRFRVGVYPCVDKTIDIAQRFDRAKMAANTVKGILNKRLAYYDEDLHKKMLYAEQLIEEFPNAIAQRQFQVYYQPKFDIRPDTPVLASAEALVRWVHPTLGMVSPGAFIPLFEENGLIQSLDHYVWEETARQIREWKDRFGITLPISVNVSRVDMFDPTLGEELTEIVANNGITAAQLLLEITESAYTDNSQQISAAVSALRSAGFKIEMDDFGSGYSSLNMLTSLTFDALKLDMAFVRNICSDSKAARLVGIIIEIARLLEVPVIAEGVEHKEQMELLETLGCDVIQGYYFSKPLPPDEFVHLIEKQQKENGYAYS